MANRFLNNIRINDEYTLPSADGSANQIIITDGAGNLSFVDTTTISVGESEQVHIACKNTSGVAISKGDPVYITGTVGASYIIQIAKADASNSAKMPAVGLAETDLAINAEGYVIVSGVLKNLTTDPLSTGDGTPSSNDTVYVKAGGGLTRTKPTGSGNLIQNVGKVGRVSSANAGSLAVSTIMRTNDVPNLTAGKIWVGSSTYTTESGVVHLDEANGRMGIGTTSPIEPLEVVGTARFDNSITEGTHYVGDSIQHWGDGGTGIYFPSNDFVDIYTASSTRLRVNSSGNVGIGTTSPSAKLEVAGDIMIDSGSLIKNTNSFNSINLYRGSDASMIFKHGHSTVGRIQFLNSSNTEVVTFDVRNEKVGIGITSPSSKLHINGGTGSLSTGLTFGDGDTGIWESADDVLRFSTSSSTRMLIDSSGNVGIGTTSPQSRLHIADANPEFILEDTTNPNKSRIRNVDGNLRYDADYNSELGNSRHQFFIDGSEKLRIDTNGNVGIGTTSPSQKLHVDGITYSTSGYKLDNGFSIGALGYNSAIRFNNGNILVNNSSSAEFVRFDATNSRVGIGTTSPDKKLEVSGDIKISGGDYNGLYFENAAGTTKTLLYQHASYDALVIKDIVNNADRVTFKNNGNVGIGTTSPSDKLTVQDGTVTSTDSSGTNYAKLDRFSGLTLKGNGAGTRGVQTPNTDALTLGTNNTERIRITSSGNVGIGTTSPLSKLHLSDTTGGSIYMQDSDGATTHNISSIGNNGNNFGIYTRSSNGTYVATDYQAVKNSSGTEYHRWFTNGDNERMRITSSGNVGIGNTSPGYHLSVNGAVQTDMLRGYTYPTTSYLDFDDDNLPNANSTSLTSVSSMAFVIDSNNNSTSDAFYWKVDGTTSTGSTIMTLADEGALQLNNYGSGTFTGTATQRLAVDSSGNVIEIPIGSGPVDGSGTANYVTKWSDADTITNSVIYDNGTNVGIGTTSLGTNDKLLIKTSVDNSVSQGLVIQRSINTDEGYINYNGGGFHFRATDGDPIVFGQVSNERVRIDSSGNVGIGTTSPDVKLHILGQLGVGNLSTGGIKLSVDQASTFPGSNTSNSRFVDFIGGNSGSNTEIGGIRWLNTDSDSGNYQYHAAGITSHNAGSSNDGDLRFFVSSDASADSSTGVIEAVRIDTDGNVGIGTTTPQSKLQVNGGVQMADDTDTASADKVGTLRYRTSGNNSYVDMCMQTGASTYEWINIVQNNW